ncbi:mediterrocin family bacteriocin [Anoxybacteroides rupiense]
MRILPIQNIVQQVISQKLRNANGTFSDQDSAGNWAGIEVTHSGSTVYYSITY